MDEMDEDVINNTQPKRCKSRRGHTSITHLMNFSSAPLLQNYRNASARESQKRKSSRAQSCHLLSDKARYIHANYRFIVKPDGNYKLQAADADQLLDWNDILQILVSPVSQDSSCPICLSRPVVPRMMTCGHILCLPCLIRYLHSGITNVIIPPKKTRWTECPICWDSINMSEMRPVRWYAGQENLPFKDGDEIVLRLITRQPGKTLALPQEGFEALRDSIEDIPWYNIEEVVDYAKIMKGGQDYMNEQYNIEIEDLKNLEKDDELVYEEGPEWTRKATSEIYEAKKRIQGLGNPPVIAKHKRQNEHKLKPMQSQTIKKANIEESSIHLLESCKFKNDVQNSGLKYRARQCDDGKSQSCGRKEHRQSERPFLFYQALPHYYLAPLDIRILKSAYGSFDSFPVKLLPRIEHISNGHIVDNELRKRMKYLSHLPQGCEIKFLECNWTGSIDPEILDQFSNEIEMRKKRNNDKKIREERDRLLAENFEDNTRWMINKAYHDNGLEAILQKSSKSVMISSDLSSTGPAHIDSFRNSQSVETDGTRTVWGTTLGAPSSAEVSSEPLEQHDNDGWLPSWEAELQVEEALITQAKDVSVDMQGTSMKSVGGKGPKKKTKKITLMSTSAKRAA